jgi:Tol biopolymer transport system component
MYIRISALLLLSCVARAQTLSRANLASNGAQLAGNGDFASEPPALSRDGGRVAFASRVTVGGASIVFIKERASGALTPVSVSFAGGASVGGHSPALSSDGRFVAFTSVSDQLAPGDTNGVHDVFVRDMQLGVTTRVSVDSTGAQAPQLSQHPSISGDGRYVAFESRASTLAPGDTNGATLDIYVHDRVSGATRLVSAGAGGTTGPAHSEMPRISRDGAFVLFRSVNDLDPQNPTGAGGVFVHELATGTTLLASFTAAGAPAAGRLASTFTDSISRGGGISADGRYVTYYIGVELYRRDRVTGAALLLNQLPNGALSDDAMGGSMTDDGRFVVWGGDGQLTADDHNSAEDVYLIDCELGRARRLSVELAGQTSCPGFCDSGNTTISGDGTAVVFESVSQVLAPNDTNGAIDVFVYDARAAAAELYCVAGTSSRGCVGALSTSGAPDGSAGGGFAIRASGVDSLRTGMVMYSLSGRVLNPFGHSFLCVAAPRQRTPASSSGGGAGPCDGVLLLDWNAFVAANPTALGAPFASLTPVQAQVWMRDPQSVAPSTLTNAVEFLACP